MCSALALNECNKGDECTVRQFLEKPGNTMVTHSQGTRIEEGLPRQLLESRFMRISDTQRSFPERIAHLCESQG